jgi:hypothetical protein
MQPLKGELNRQRPLVDHLLESIPQGGMDFHSGPNDAVSEFFVKHGVLPLSKP